MCKIDIWIIDSLYGHKDKQISKKLYCILSSYAIQKGICQLPQHQIAINEYDQNQCEKIAQTE